MNNNNDCGLRTAVKINKRKSTFRCMYGILKELAIKIQSWKGVNGYKF